MYLPCLSYFHQGFPNIFKFLAVTTLIIYILYIKYSKSDRSIIAWYIFYAITQRIKILSFFIFLQQLYSALVQHAVMWLPYCSNQKLALNYNLTKQLLPVRCANGIGQGNLQNHIFSKILISSDQKRKIYHNKILKTYRLVIIVSKILNFQEEKILNLKKIAPDAAFFTSIHLDNSAENIDISSQTDTTDENDVTCLPEPLTSLFDSTAVNLGNDDLTSLHKDIYSQYHQKYRQKSYNNLTKVTILQSFNYNWKLHRGGRITASSFHEVCHKKVNDEGNQNSLFLTE